MSERSRRRWLVLVVLGAGALGTGCQSAADLGLRAAAAVVETAVESAARGGSSAEPAAASEPSSPSSETPCRKKQREWREKEGNPRTEPPPYLRCNEHGEWPDESEVRSGGGTPGI